MLPKKSNSNCSLTDVSSETDILSETDISSESASYLSDSAESSGSESSPNFLTSNSSFSDNSSTSEFYMGSSSTAPMSPGYSASKTASNEVPFSPMSPRTTEYLVNFFPSPSKADFHLPASTSSTEAAQGLFHAFADFPPSPSSLALHNIPEDAPDTNSVSRVNASLSLAASLLLSPESSKSNLPSSVEVARSLYGARLPLGHAAIQNFLKSPSAVLGLESSIDAVDARVLSPLSSRGLGASDFLSFLDDGDDIENFLSARKASTCSASSFSYALSSEFSAGSSESVSRHNKRKANNCADAKLSEKKKRKTSKCGRQIKPSYKLR